MNSALQDAVAEVPNLVAIQNKLNDYGMAELVVKQVIINTSRMVTIVGERERSN